MLVSVEGLDVLGEVDFVDVDKETAKAINGLGEMCDVGNYEGGGEFMKSYEDNTGKVGKWSLAEYFAKADSTGGYDTVSLGSQIREKCDQCDIDTPCCEAGCGVWEYKVIERDNPCQHCKFDGECFGVMDSLEDYITEIDSVVKADTVYAIYEGERYTFGDVSLMDESIKKYILYIKLMNESYRYYGNEDLMFKVSKKADKVVVKFQGKEYYFPGNMSKKEIMVKVYHDVQYYRKAK